MNSRALEKLIDQLLNKLTLQQKTQLCQGCSTLSVGDLPELGIGKLNMHDGPQGVRLEDGRTATALPCGIALSCTFDIATAEAYGELLGRECNALNIHALLGPGFNLMRTPLNGRTFEYFGEDPVLAGRMAAGYVRGCQRQKVAATPKHLALNNQEICRTCGNSIVDERTLQELYLRSFELVVREAQPWMMMSSFNRINGEFASACHHVQQELAKEHWGFDGVMVSDWGAAHSTIGCAMGGLDLEMGTRNCFGPALQLAVENGSVPLWVVDDKVRRILRLMFRTGVLGEEPIPAGEWNTCRHHQLARSWAQEGMVLLKNSGHFLPWQREKLKTLAVIGPAADFHHHSGGLEKCGGSGAVYPEYEITPLTGLREYVGDKIKLIYAPGIEFQSECVAGAELFPQGIKTEFFTDSSVFPAPDAKPFATRHYPSPNQCWGQFMAAGVTDTEPLSHQMFSLRMTGELITLKSGTIRVALNNSHFLTRLYLDDQLISEITRGCYPAHEAPEIVVKKHQKLRFRLEARRTACNLAEIRVLYQDGAKTEFKRALEVASQADAVLFVGGSTHRYDRECFGFGDVPNADIPNYELPDNQSALIQALTQVNPNLAVALINGSPVNVEPWINEVAALIECWYPGMEGGRALAEVLFGEAEPGGRLSCSWARNLNDYPCHGNGSYPGERGEINPHVEYPEGIFIGYRAWEKKHIAPRFAFGFGLGYTSWALSKSTIAVEQCDLVQEKVKVRVTAQVSNTGQRRGATVLQLYVSDLTCPVPRPIKELMHFAKIQAAPGEARQVEFELTYRDFAYFEVGSNRFTVSPGQFTVSLGWSSAEVLVQMDLDLN